MQGYICRNHRRRIRHKVYEDEHASLPGYYPKTGPRLSYQKINRIYRDLDETVPSANVTVQRLGNAFEVLPRSRSP